LTSEETDNAKDISLKTLWNSRNIVAKNNLEEDIFSAGTNELAQVFKYQRAFLCDLVR